MIGRELSSTSIAASAARESPVPSTSGTPIHSGPVGAAITLDEVPLEVGTLTYPGLSAADAKRRLEDALLAQFPRLMASNRGPVITRALGPVARISRLGLALCAVLLLISFGVNQGRGGSKHPMGINWIVEGLLLLVILLVNTWIDVREWRLKTFEVAARLRHYLSEFARLEAPPPPPRFNRHGKAVPPPPPPAGLATSASISLVSACRDYQWLKVPANMLANGDLIQLTIGEAAPATMRSVEGEVNVEPLPKGTVISAALRLGPGAPSPPHRGPQGPVGAGPGMRKSHTTNDIAAIRPHVRFLGIEDNPRERSDSALVSAIGASTISPSPSTDALSAIADAGASDSDDPATPPTFSPPARPVVPPPALGAVGLLPDIDPASARHRFEVIEASAVSQIQPVLQGKAVRPPPALSKYIAAVERFSLWLLLAGVLVSIAINVGRCGAHASSYDCVEIVLVRVSYLAMCLLPIAAPAFLAAVRALGVARVLAFYELLQGTSGLRGGEDPDNEFDVEGRHRRKEEFPVDPRRIFHYLVRVVRGDPRLLVRSCDLLYALGQTTAVCCVDKEGVLSEPVPTVEEAFMLKKDQTEVLEMICEPASKFGVRFEEGSWKQHMGSLKPLGLACLANCPCYRLARGDGHGHHHAREAKDVGAAQGGGAGAGGQSPAAAPHAPHPVRHARPPPRPPSPSLTSLLLPPPSSAGAAGGQAPATPAAPQPRGYGNQPDTPRRANMQYQPPHVMASVLEDRAGSFHVVTRGNPTMVVEQVCPAGSLGPPPPLLGWCGSFWDGEEIRELTPDERADILNQYHQWNHEGDFHCVAFSYSPVEARLSAFCAGEPYSLHLVRPVSGLAGRGQPTISIAVVIAPLTWRSPDARQPPDRATGLLLGDRPHRAAAAAAAGAPGGGGPVPTPRGGPAGTSGGVGLNAGAGGAGAGLGGGPSAAQAATPRGPGVYGHHHHHHSHRRLDAAARMQIAADVTEAVSPLAVPESAKRANTDRGLVMKDHVFLGMAALRSQPKREASSSLVEQLRGAGIRFIFFSPGHERAVRSFGAKLGLETDWNCCINLRDPEPGAAPAPVYRDGLGLGARARASGRGGAGRGGARKLRAEVQG
eukprot:tig00000632_g2748.t1